MRNSIIKCIQDIKGLGIVEIDLSKTDNSVCDFFIICHADSNTQVRAIGKNIEETLKAEHKETAFHAEGYDNSQWVLLDYGNILVHIFLEPVRNYYKLEELWADAKIKRISEPEEDF